MAYLVLNQSDIFIGNEPLIDSWPLMSTPWAMIGIVACYLHFSIISGPKFMEKREPLPIKTLIIVYNAIQIYFAGWLVSRSFYTDNFIKYFFTFGCNPIHRENQQLLEYTWSCGWWYFIAKITDLLDTVFFVLRKKQSHISFLHLYHHASMVIYVWLILKYTPVEQSVMIGYINSFVHFVMYFYYFLAALGPRVQPYLWWKKYLTRLQLVQFILICVYMSFSVSLSCKALNRFLTYFFACNSLLFIYLFGRFYRQTYLKQKTEKKSS